MPSIKQKFYGIIRQFSANTVVVGSQDDDGDEVAGGGTLDMQNNPVLLVNHHNVMVEGGSQGLGGTMSSLKKPSSLSTNSYINNSDKRSSPVSPTEHSFIYRYLTGRLKKPRHPEIYYGKTGVDLPVLHLCPLNNTLIASYSGPDGGLTRVPPVRKRPMANIANLDDELNLSFDGDCTSESASSSGDRFSTTALSPPPPYFTNGHTHKYNLADSDDACSTASSERNFNETLDWKNFNERAYGLSTSLYECNPITKVYAGNPVADVFAVCARQNSCILALADGVNWGEKSRLAARCAIRGAIEHLNDSMYNGDRDICTTLDVFHCLLGAFHAGHHLILQEGGALTTLCVMVLCPLKDAVHWVACACNVGDSLAFVFSQNYGVREITLGSHDIQQMRDMRDAGGALGPVDGVNPELHNMTCSMTIVDPGDIVFITSDGVSDNFDPVVGKFCLIRNEMTAADKENWCKQSTNASAQGLASCKSPQHDRRRSAENGLREKQSVKTNSVECDDDANGMKLEINLPMVEAYQRHELMLLRMEDLLRNGVTIGDPSAQSAKDLCENLINFATQLTMAKRKILEDPELYQGEGKSTRGDQKHRRKLVRQKISEMPGKLDHATVVAYQIGDKYPSPMEGDSSATTPEYDEKNHAISNGGVPKVNSNSFESDSNGTLDTPTPRRHQLVAVEYDLLLESESSQKSISLPVGQKKTVERFVEMSEANLLSNFVEEKLLRPFTSVEKEEEDENEVEIFKNARMTDDDDDEFLLEEFYDSNSSVGDENSSKLVSNGQVRPSGLLSTIHEASNDSKEVNPTMSFDSDTLLVVFTSDGHTTVPSSELDSYAVTPPSVLEVCLETKKTVINDTSLNVALSRYPDADMSIESASCMADFDQISADLTVSATSTSLGIGLDDHADDVFDLEANNSSLTRPIKGRIRDCNSVDTDAPYSRMLNQSYYLATSQEESLHLPPIVSVPEAQASVPSSTKQPSTSRFKKLSKTWERFERAVPSFRKPKKHPRGSPQRHTVAVDSAQWQEYKKADKRERRLPSDTRNGLDEIATPNSPKRTPSLHIPWSPIRSLKFFKTLTSPRHSLIKETLRDDKVCPRPDPSLNAAPGCSLDANCSGDLNINDDKLFQVSHSASDPQIARGNVRLESTV